MTEHDGRTYHQCEKCGQPRTVRKCETCEYADAALAEACEIISLMYYSEEGRFDKARAFLEKWGKK